jgi:NAD(P)-dependent dehydrogenase (short-subunit alcohol dehydrogenase family)
MSSGTSEAREGLLEGRRALVTGGSGGIGRGIAAVFAREGARIAFTYSSNAEGAETTLALVRRWGEGLAIRADLRDRAAPGRVIAEVEEAGAASTCWSTTPPSARSVPLLEDVTGTSSWS